MLDSAASHQQAAPIFHIETIIGLWPAGPVLVYFDLE